MLNAILTLLNLASFITGAPKQTPLGLTVDLGYAINPGDQPYMVDLGYATYQGKRDMSHPNTVVYLGIPYAEPPVGDKRFRATVALNEARVTKGTNGQLVDATSYPLPCIQGSLDLFWDAGPTESEDCLNVNVYIPHGAKANDNLPVMFYIHGGGWLIGDPSEWPFEHWINQSPDVIIVSVYYRLASFGFLAAPEFTNATYGDFNAGFKDQIQALTWVKKHIRKFGGDPTKVTIVGHSAGADAVNLHMTTKESQGLFSQAIAQSLLFQSYSSFAGCGNSSMEEQMACLRSASISALVQAQYTATSVGVPYQFYPVLDGVLITEHPTSKFQRGDFAHVPLVVGSASNDTLSFDLVHHNISNALKTYFPLLTDTDIQQFLWIYRETDFVSATQRFWVATGESELICAVQAMGGPSSRYSDNTWTYRYNTPDPAFGLPVVTHAAENFMMFDGRTTFPNGTVTKWELTPVQLAFASELIAYWLSFVRTGNPNTHKLAMSPEWTKYSESNTVRMVLMQESHNSTIVSGSYMETRPVAENARCTFVIGMAEVCQN
ncbi:Alpha/Beta hydrolase protein [Suillus ampliporus]|nr:Alpha/Beta hydrolase protein [Suillus ampliporus]